MIALVLLLGLFVTAMGVLAIIAPRAANHLARMFANRSGLYAAAAIRLALGGGLVFVADASRAPMILRVFGGIILIVGVLTPLIGLERHCRMIDWWLSAGTALQRTCGTVTLAFGLFLIYAIT